VAARDRFLGFGPAATRQPSCDHWRYPLQLGDLKADFNNPTSQIVGTEFVGTSITSDFPAQFIAPVTAALTDNPILSFSMVPSVVMYAAISTAIAGRQTSGGINHPRAECRHQHPSFLCGRRWTTGRSACHSSIHLWYKPHLYSSGNQRDAPFGWALLQLVQFRITPIWLLPRGFGTSGKIYFSGD